MTTPKYLAFDPGLKSGYAYFDDTGSLMRKGEESHEETLQFLSWLLKAPVEITSELVLIVEDFKLLEHKASVVARNVRSRSMEASQVIGALRLFSMSTGAKLVKQVPEKGTRVAAAWTGLIAPRGQHLANWKSAVNHGTYYLVTNKILSLDQVMK